MICHRRRTTTHEILWDQGIAGRWLLSKPGVNPLYTLLASVGFADIGEFAGGSDAEAVGGGGR